MGFFNIAYTHVPAHALIPSQEENMRLKAIEVHLITKHAKI